MPPQFIPGAELSSRLYHESLRPLLSQHFPGLPHTAALIGTGSEVLGFDTQRSTDHDCDPRLQLFLHPGDRAAHSDKICELLAERLPATLAGYPTNLVPNGDTATRHMRPTTGPIRHGVVIAELGDWLNGHLGFNPQAGITTHDWLATPTQALAELTTGSVHHDGLGQLHRVRRALAWYPDDL